MNNELITLAENLGNRLIEKNKTITLAESCTGGLIAATLTAVAGSSAWFEYGFVTYSNAAKMQLLNVQTQTLKNYGAVSEQTAQEMVLGALSVSKADIAIAVTGIAGPAGGSLQKPVGTIYIAWANKEIQPIIKRYLLTGNRTQIRLQTVKIALNGVNDLL